MLAGMRYVRFAPPIHSVLLRSGQLHHFGQRAMVAAAAGGKVELHRGSTGYGVLLGCLGVGSILGALMLHRLRQIFSTDAMVTCPVALFGAANILLAYLTSYSCGSSRADRHRRCMDDRELHAHHGDADVRAGLGPRSRSGCLSAGLPRRHGRG